MSIFAHAVVMICGVGIVLPASVVAVMVPSFQVHRRTIHATLQVLLLALLCIGVALVPRNSEQLHGVLGYGILYVGFPVVLLSRLLPDVYHRVLGHVLTCFMIGISYGGVTLYPDPIRRDLYPEHNRVLKTVAFVVLSFGATVYLGVYLNYLLYPPGIRRLGKLYTKVPNDGRTPEGSGWTLFLSKKWFGRKTISMRQLRGKTPGEEARWWGAGTTIRDVQRSLRKEGLTLAGHPSLLGASLGGWIATGSHGSGGTLWKPAFSELQILDIETERVFRMRARDFEPKPTWIIVEVLITPVRNQTVLRIAFDIRTVHDATRYLETETFLRLIFVDKERATAFIWTRDTDVESNSSLIPPWLAVIIPTWISSRIDRRRWTCRQTLANANAFAPDPPFFSTIFMLLYTNFEVFVSVRVTKTLLCELCDGLKTMFATKVAGRCEIRGSKSKLILDFAIRDKNSELCITTVRRILGPHSILTLHKGKAQVLHV